VLKNFRYALRQSRGRLDEKVLILMYHSIAEKTADPWSLCVTPQHFCEQLEVLRKQARPVGLQELVRVLSGSGLSRRSVVVTFDDGYANNLYNAKPLLERYEIPATVFLATGCLGHRREFWWDELEKVLLQPGSLPEIFRLTLNGTTHQWHLGERAQYDEEAFQRYRSWKAWEDPPTTRHSLYISLWQLMNPLLEGQRQSVLSEIRDWARYIPEARASHRPLSVDEVRLLEGNLIEAGSHTVTHSVLSSLPADWQRDEIYQSKKSLEGLVGHPVTSFAFPYGRQCDYTSETMALVRAAGFTCACVAFEGVVRGTTDRFQLPRFPVLDWDGEEFERRLTTWFEG
jgi:peptidoglycan/xylan/chitin deacetylase (PgdA/CDA1 family)